jgi:hypothetical protein
MFFHQVSWFLTMFSTHAEPCRGARLALLRNNHCFCILQLLEGCANMVWLEKHTFFGWENQLIDVENLWFFLGGKAHHFGDEHVHCRKIQLIDGENPNSV